jgi:hypothetical protein
MRLHSYRQRVVDEKAELDGRRARLAQFVAGTVFRGTDPEDRRLFLRQQDAMTGYSAALGLRIERFIKASGVAA